MARSPDNDAGGFADARQALAVRSGSVSDFAKIEHGVVLLLLGLLLALLQAA